MSINKFLIPTLILAAGSLGNLSAKQNVQRNVNSSPNIQVEVKEDSTPATLEDLRKAALAFEEADNDFTSHPHGNLSVHYKSIFKIRVMNSTRNEEDVKKAVNIALKSHHPGSKSSHSHRHHFHKKNSSNEAASNEAKASNDKSCASKQAHFEFAKNEVMRKFNGYVEKSKKGMTEASNDTYGHDRLRPIIKAARDYYWSMVGVSAKVKEKYQKQNEARMECRRVVKSLMEQGHSSDAIKQEMVNAGVRNPYVLSKPAYWEKKKQLGVS